MSGFDFRFELAEMDVFEIYCYGGSPAVSSFFGGDAFEFRESVYSCPCVSGVLGGRCEPEIFSSVVHAVAVDMVNKQACGRFHNKSVHAEGFAAAVNVSEKVGVVSCLRASGGPSVLCHLGIVAGADEGV